MDCCPWEKMAKTAWCRCPCRWVAAEGVSHPDDLKLCDMTHRVASLALDGNRDHASTIWHDLLADLGRLGTEVGTSNHSELHLAVHYQS